MLVKDGIGTHVVRNPDNISRNKRIQYFVTIPQSGQLSYDEIIAQVPPYSFLLVAREEHDDGNPHFHFLIKLRNGVNFLNFLKYLQVKFPLMSSKIDVSIVQKDDNMKFVDDYISKEDPRTVRIGSWKKEPKPISDSQRIKNWAKKTKTEQQSAMLTFSLSLDDNKFFDFNPTDYIRPRRKAGHFLEEKPKVF